MSRRKLRLVLGWVLDHGSVRLRFDDGVEGEVEILSRMRGPVFKHARTERGFSEVSVDQESGTIVWPGADLAPDTLYERVRTGSWPGSEVPA